VSPQLRSVPSTPAIAIVSVLRSWVRWLRRQLPTAVLSLSLVAVGSGFDLGAQSSIQGDVATIVITHVTIIDVAGGRRLPNRTVVIRGNRIVAVASGSSARSSHVLVVAGRGKFLIPGLWDMHVHVADDTLGMLSLFVANGITGVRDMGGDLDAAMAGVIRIRRGHTVSPRVVAAGTIIDGAPTVYPEVSVTARTPAEGRHWVDSLAMRGVDFIKAYEMLRPEVVMAIMDEARQHHLPVVGHVPLSMDAGTVSDLGYHSLEHMRNVDVSCSSVADSLRMAAADQLRSAENGVRPGSVVRSSIHDARRPRVFETFDSVRCDALLLRFRRNDTWQVPTFVVGHAFLTRADTSQRNRDVLPYLSPATRSEWANVSHAWDIAQAEYAKQFGGAAAFAAAGAQLRARDHAIFRRMLALGVPVLAGTDFGNPWVTPGFSLHDELATFVQDGMSPLDALRSATLSPARFLAATDSLGTIASGKLADLVLLDADPLIDISNLQRIRAVFANGRLFDRAALDALLASAKRAGRVEPAGTRR
jgi:imidazolonepropionase-like amidohydrolase